MKRLFAWRQKTTSVASLPRTCLITTVDNQHPHPLEACWWYQRLCYLVQAAWAPRRSSYMLRCHGAHVHVTRTPTFIKPHLNNAVAVAETLTCFYRQCSPLNSQDSGTRHQVQTSLIQHGYISCCSIMLFIVVAVIFLTCGVVAWDSCQRQVQDYCDWLLFWCCCVRAVNVLIIPAARCTIPTMISRRRLLHERPGLLRPYKRLRRWIMSNRGFQPYPRQVQLDPSLLLVHLFVLCIRVYQGTRYLFCFPTTDS